MCAAAKRDFDSRGTWTKFRREAQPFVQAFRHGHADPGLSQRARLASILRASKDTPFGRHSRFASIDSYETYVQRVPVSNWSEFQPWIDRACREPNTVLCAERPLFFEPTSGSSAARKLIPYTRSLLVEFQQAIVVWLAMLYDDCPDIALGRSYWAMSPPLPARKPTENGIPVGGANDMSYLADSCALPLLGGVLNPPGLSSDPGKWRTETVASMIAAVDLRMISVWSPTFLIALLRPLTTSGEAVDAVRRRLDGNRWATLKAALANGDFSAIWPELRVISCWMDGPSEGFVAQLRDWLPQTRFSPKGLLATEGVVSISNGFSRSCPLAINSHFLEFADPQGQCVLADSLEAGTRYRPILTTGGGLYRYALGDIVEYQEIDDGLHCVRFVGRDDARSDLVGEKLDEQIVAQACSGLGTVCATATLVPLTQTTQAGYALLIDGTEAAQSDALARTVESRLMAVHHYAQARRIGQLAGLRAVPVRDLTGLLQHAWHSLGRRAGDLKPGRLVVSAPFARAIISRLADEKDTE